MVSEKEKTSIRRFVCDQLRDEPDLSTVTLGILRKCYLAHVGRESLSPEARNYLKQVVQEELMKMQDSDESGSDLETKKPQSKRKREKENDEIINGSEDESRAKKSRCQSSSSSESEDKEDCKTGSEESEGEDDIKSGSEDAEQEVKNPQLKTNGNAKQQLTSEDSTDEEMSESEKKGNESNCDDSPKEKIKKKASTAENGKTKNGKTSEGKKTRLSDEGNETDTDSKSETSDKMKDTSLDHSEKEKVSAEKKNDEPDSDSSSLPSLDDEQNSGTENKQDGKKKKTVKKQETARDQKDDNKAVVRFKRYIALCGVRRNYKKLLSGCSSVLSKVAVLKKELEDLGVQGKPSIEKCKKVRIKREEAQELADIDISNIIATQGRPKRRGASAWQEQHDPPASTYQRALNSDSDSDEESNTHRGHRRATDWENLQGIISDDADSD